MLYLSDKSKSKLDIVYYTYIKAKDQNIEQVFHKLCVYVYDMTYF